MKLENLLRYVAARAAERSTWEGLSLLAPIIGWKLGNVDFDQCAYLGGLAYGAVRILLPDPAPTAQGSVQPSNSEEKACP